MAFSDDVVMAIVLFLIYNRQLESHQLIHLIIVINRAVLLFIILKKKVNLKSKFGFYGRNVSQFWFFGDTVCQNLVLRSKCNKIPGLRVKICPILIF